MNRFGKIGMRRWLELRRVGLITALLFALFLVLYPRYGRGPHPPASKVPAEMSSIKVAMNQYKAEYNAYPQGSTDDIFNLLIGKNVNGKNPRKHVFLDWNHSKQMVDPWNTPYQIEFINPDSVLIKSAGKNKEFGDADDVIWPAVK